MQQSGIQLVTKTTQKRCLIGPQKGVSKGRKGHLLQAKRALIESLLTPFWFSVLELSLQDRRTKRDRMTEWQKMTEEQKKTEWQNEQKGQKGQKEIYYVNMILLWPRIDCNVEIYSNCAITCCTIDFNRNFSYELL